MPLAQAADADPARWKSPHDLLKLVVDRMAELQSRHPERFQAQVEHAFPARSPEEIMAPLVVENAAQVDPVEAKLKALEGSFGQLEPRRPGPGDGPSFDFEP